MSGDLINKQFGVDFDQEIHCDECMDVVHVHFEHECPVCRTRHASTSMSWSISDVIEVDKGIFSCEQCNTVFKILKYEYADAPEALIEIVSHP